MLPKALGAKLGLVERLGAKLPVKLGGLDTVGFEDGTIVGSVEMLGVSVGK